MIPAVRGGEGGLGGPNPVETIEEGNVNIQAEELTDDKLILAEPFIPIFGTEIMKKIFSKDWHCREAGFKEVIREAALGRGSTLLG